jgi:hypothetical protein
MPLCPQITNTPITVSQTGDFTVTSVIPAVSDTIDGLAQDFDNIVVQLDDKTKAYYQNDAPTTGLNEGDIWFDTNDGNKQYFYTGTAWVSVQDTAIAAAAAAASAAQTTADGKNRVYRQTAQPTGGTYVEGDLWFDTDDDNKIYRYTSGSWATAVPLGNNALGNLSANKITSGSIDASVITVSNLNAGNISTGTLAAARIAAGSLNADKITAGTITASQIATGTITATQIAAGTITTDKLVAGTLTGYTINNGSGTFSVSSAGVLAASSGTIGGFTLSTDRIGDLSGTYIGTNGTLAITTINVRASSGATGITMVSGSNIGMNSGNIVMGNGNLTGATNISLNGTFTINSGGSMVSAAPITITGSNNLIVGGTATVNGSATVDGSATFNSTMFAPNLTVLSSGAYLRVATGAVGEIREEAGSSIRFKQDIVDLAEVTAIDAKKLLNIPVRAFKFKDTYLSPVDERFGAYVPGFIAEEMDEHYPIAVDHSEDGAERWNSSYLVPGMLALIQDLYKEIAILKGE